MKGVCERGESERDAPWKTAVIFLCSTQTIPVIKTHIYSSLLEYFCHVGSNTGAKVKAVYIIARY